MTILDIEVNFQLSLNRKTNNKKVLLYATIREVHHQQVGQTVRIPTCSSNRKQPLCFTEILNGIGTVKLKTKLYAVWQTRTHGMGGLVWIRKSTCSYENKRQPADRL